MRRKASHLKQQLKATEEVIERSKIRLKENKYRKKASVKREKFNEYLIAELKDMVEMDEVVK